MAERRTAARLWVTGAIVAGVLTTAACGVLPPMGPAVPPEAAGSTLGVPDPARSATESPGPTPSPTPTTTSLFGDTYAALDADSTTIERWEASVLRIRSVTCTGVYTGSGFVVDPHTVVTNQHVVNGASLIQVDTVDGREITVKDVSQASDIDLAVIHTDATLPVPLPLAPDNAAVGQHVAAIGYPLGGPVFTSTGTVEGWFVDTQLKGGLAMRSSTTVDHGNSGGPILNRHGAVVAVVYAKSGDGTAGSIGVSVLNAHLANANGFATPVSCSPS